MNCIMREEECTDLTAAQLSVLCKQGRARIYKTVLPSHPLFYLQLVAKQLRRGQLSYMHKCVASRLRCSLQ